MTVIMATVVSLNGKVTKGTNPNIHDWSSKEDWYHFVALRDKSNVVIIDQHTFETVNPSAEAGKLRIVLTPHPRNYEYLTVADQLEFSNLKPKELINSLAKRQRKNVLVAGGAELCSHFLAAGLIDSLYVSIEPVMFGSGEPMLKQDSLSVSLHLKSVSRLNERGTLLLHYTPLKQD